MPTPAIIGSVLLGLALGVAIAGAVAWRLTRRHLKRVRAAERRARAAERMAEIGAMTGGLAHEIKNPLSTIGLNAQLLIESIEDSSLPQEERTRLLSRMKSLRREVERLRDILTDFLEFAGKVHLEPQPLDINHVVGELVDFYLPEAERHGVRLRTQPWHEPLLAPIDAKLYKQAILNLLLNATQAMAPSTMGPPVPRPADAAQRDLILKSEPGQDADGAPTVCLHVIDTGPGIAPETLGRIFTPYFTTKSAGSGLGLPMSRRLIEEHGGRIEVHSEVGRGSDFTVIVPMAPAPPS
ncbi:MAG: two-component sensor histidine kinase [Phycisphaerales bacterium]|nr:two-component sensor histidine kinase [Phycisphaerales bacterium]